MINQKIAKILYEISILLDMDDIQFKPRAYEKASLTIQDLNEDLEVIYKKGGIKAIKEIPSIGEGISRKIEEFIKNGKIKEYEELKEKFPVDIDELKRVEGLGPKGIKFLYKKLKIKNIEELERAAKENKLRNFEGWGQKKEDNILKGIEFIKKGTGRFPLGQVFPLINEIRDRIGSLKEVKKVIIAGSVRRWKETIGDVDILVISDNPKPIMEFFTKMPEVGKIYGKGETKSTVKLMNGMDIDIRVVEEKSYGAALNYFTGSKEHNVALRQIAKDKGLKLSEYGLFKGNKFIAGRTEEELYKTLGLRYIEPELRESHGDEIKAAKENKLPRLINYDELKGDLQVQTNWTDGSNSIKEMALEAKKYGLQYIVITDHTKTLAMTGGLKEKDLIQQGKEIARINKELNGIRIFKGAEVNILKDGSLDINDETLEQLDVVGIAVHSNFNMSKEDMTNRIIKAMKNKHADILFHPTGRIIHKREPFQVDMDKIIKMAIETNTILEIDAYPDRLDLNDEYIKKAIKMGAKLSIDSDAHNIKHFDFLKFGIAQARRGWAAKNDIINTMGLKEFEGYINQKRQR
ncbi:DNA polymerase/3'-5' exonuclease PolX [Candidatus Woesearchaeota archaeon]|nr:DNA polymerase/3'-5' exonuclease PolX [Candidatus Woesearchaeota archaeon]